MWFKVSLGLGTKNADLTLDRSENLNGDYSVRNALIGSILAARRAGR